MDDLAQLERKVQEIYDQVLRPLAQRTAFDLPMSGRDAPGLPSVLFLGNHSSGKSSFINHLINAKLQKTGLAPTDDGFTIITFGEKQDEFDGQTVVTHPDLAFKDLQQFGPSFLGRLRLKTFPHDLLKRVTLIDSPGMIDAAGNANTRGYDFASSVRFFAERADLILFFFDPDKPGTTGETISIFNNTLAGLTYKLMIVMNKVDLFRNIRDFARTYGTLCWNLAKTIQTKDIPHIFTTYLPTEGAAADKPPSLPLEDFTESREEVIAEVQRAPTRRADNLVSDLYKNARRLATHVRVCQEVAKRYRAIRRSWLLGIAALLVVAGAAAWLTWDPDNLRAPILISVAGLVLAIVAWIISKIVLNRYVVEVTDSLEPYFRTAFRQELALRERADLEGWWENVQPQTKGALRSLGPQKMPRSLMTRRALKRLDKIVQDEIPELRRSIAGYHRERRQVGVSGAEAK